MQKNGITRGEKLLECAVRDHYDLANRGHLLSSFCQIRSSSDERALQNCAHKKEFDSLPHVQALRKVQPRATQGFM